MRATCIPPRYFRLKKVKANGLILIAMRNVGFESPDEPRQFAVKLSSRPDCREKARLEAALAFSETIYKMTTGTC